MKNTHVATLCAVAAQFLILMPVPGLTRTQSPAPQTVQPSASLGSQQDPYAEAFSGLTYSDKQKEAIGKIGEDIASRKAAVRKDEKLTPSQKDAMLTGYTRMQYSLIFKELTPQQQKQVSTRIHARRASDQAAQRSKAPTQ